MERLCQLIMDIVEHQIKQTLYVYRSAQNASGWVKLDPADMQGYRQVRVKVNPLLPTDEYARSSRAINEMKAGLRSRASAMEMVGIEQPDEMMRAIDVDNVKQHPAIQAQLAQEALKRYGVKMQEASPGPSGMDVMQQFGNYAPGLQQAMQVMAAPGVPANPGPPTMPPQGLAGMPQQGPVMQPRGIGTGMAPGVQMQGPGR
jgi:hypothetical protein